MNRLPFPFILVLRTFIKLEFFKAWSICHVTIGFRITFSVESLKLLHYITCSGRKTKLSGQSDSLLDSSFHVSFMLPLKAFDCFGKSRFSEGSKLGMSKRFPSKETICRVQKTFFQRNPFCSFIRVIQAFR